MTDIVEPTPKTTSPEPFRPWNLGKLIGQKPPLKLREVWAIRIRLQIQERLRDLAMFNLAIDSKLRGCDLVALRVDDVLLSGRVRPRTTVIQKKTSRPVQFEITEQTRETVMQWIIKGGRRSGEWLFPSRIGKNKHLTTRNYARLMDGWVTSIGLDPVLYGTHSLRRTKVALIYRRTGNLRAVQLLLGHTKLESTVRYLGIEVDDALAIPSRWISKPKAAALIRRRHFADFRKGCFISPKHGSR